MKSYFVVIKGAKEGPFSFEDLRNIDFQKDTLFWREGLKDWVEAGELEELNSILITKPPPIPKVDHNTRVKPVNQSSSFEYINCTFFGIGLIIAMITAMASNLITRDNEGFFYLISFVVKIFSAFWIYEVASKQNRNKIVWAFFGFWFTSIALVIIGLLRRKDKF